MAMTKKLSVILHDLLRSEFINSSKSLRKFARKRDYLKDHYRILKHEDVLYIGYVGNNGWVVGAKLLQVACGYFITYAYPHIKDVEDVTQWFIDEYKNKGMCAYAGDFHHEWNVDENPQLEDGTVRTCIHCGKQETLKSKMVKKTWWE